MIDIDSERFYLTSTGRLARHLQRSFRLQSLREGKQGWESLHAMSLNAWLDRTWSESWPERMPAPDLYRLNLWKELSGTIPPPLLLASDTNLCAMLDENYGVMVRHGLDPTSGFPSTPLVEWRRKICMVFQKSLESAGLFHPSLRPALIRQAIAEGNIVLPEKISLAGFESPAPLERELFVMLEGKSHVEYIDTPERRAEKVEALTLPSPEQEVTYLVHRLVEDARTIPLHQIGVIVPDMDRYARELERSLRDVMADTAPHGLHWFNMTKGIPLIDTHLMQAALLPLRFIIEEQPREFLLSLFLSPYYGCWQGRHRRIARSDIIWRKRSLDSGFDNLISVLEREDPQTYALFPPEILKCLSSFCHTAQVSEKKSGSFWTEELREVWTRLGFPVLSDEKDTVDGRGLDEIMDEIDRHLSEVRMDGSEFFSWLTHLASRKVAQIGAAEDAGIQIMGMIESRGLDFDKLYVLGMDDRSLPEPIRPLPLLDSTERKLVQGGTVESQYEFAKRAYGHMMTLAPDITLLRAEMEDLKPLAPSPFWPTAEEKRSIDIWNEPEPTWLRAGWLRSACKGLHEAISPDLIIEKLYGIERIPDSVSVSRFQTAVICPYRFFVEAILKTEPLEEIEPDASPREKGNRVHRALSLFTKRLREQDMDLISERATDLLRLCVDDALHNVADKPHWEVERRRWIGVDGKPEGGILTDWLDRERERWLDGWRCIAEESPFDALTVSGLPFTLKGRIDRIDFNKEGGVLLWDYKTGTPSTTADIITNLKDPQLVVYLLALVSGHIPALEPYIDSNTPFSSGYIRLKSSGDIRISPIKGIESSLEKWEEAIAKLGELLEGGDFRPEPFPVSEVTDRYKTCEKCPDITLCQVGVLGLQATTTEEETDEETE